MSTQEPAQLDAGRQALVRYGSRMLADGLAVGSAGNLSVRIGDVILITPSGVDYREMRAADICALAADGTLLDAPEQPSTEVPMHLAIYAATTARAIVHTHSAEVVAVSATCTELPAIHYAITGLGGPVRVAPYARFGSGSLADAAVSALAGRSAVILQNHGAVCYGASLPQAYDRANLLEWLAQVYRLARCHGSPRILSQPELDEVAAEISRIRYGARRGGQAGPSAPG